MFLIICSLKQTKSDMLHERSFLMAKKNVFLHFLSNYIVVLLLFFTLFVMGPSEIFFGNYKEFGFVYQEFGWKFLIFAFLISFIFTLVISFFPDKLGKYILSVFWGIGIAGYIQTMFLNRHLEQMGARAEAYTASPSKIIVNSIYLGNYSFLELCCLQNFNRISSKK